MNRRIEPARARTGTLALLGLLSFIAYWIIVSISMNPRLTIVYDVHRSRYGGPLTWPSRWLHLAGISEDARMWLFMGLAVAVVAMWLAAIYVVRNDNRRVLALIIGAGFLMFATLFVFGPSFQSRDLFSYGFYGRVSSVYHKNPFLLIPNVRQHDIFFPYIGWRYNASVYGPVFNYLSYLIAKISSDSVTVNVLCYKLLAFLSYAACLPLVYALTRRVSPGRENMALAITAWSPVLVLHILGAGHNDILMIALILAGFLLYRKGYLLTGIVVVLLGAMVKITGVLALAPMLVLYVRDKRGAPLKRAVAAGATVAGVTVAVYLPFLQSLDIFKTTSRMSKVYSSTSVPKLVSYAYERLLVNGGVARVRAEEIAHGRVQLMFLALFLVMAVILLLRVKDYRTMVFSAAALFLAWFLTTSYILPWYVAPGLMLAAILGWNLLTASMVGMSSVFVLYRLPELPAGGLTLAGQPGPNPYISVPFLMILVGWISLSAAKWVKSRRPANAGATRSPGGT
jgi:alpha-1,6-mannosyltransferase